MKSYSKAKMTDFALIAGIVVVGVAAVMTAPKAKADEPDFMAMETEHQRIAEANGECELHRQLGADLQACVSAYFCSNWGDCDRQNMQPIEQTPSGGVYRDITGG
jgi:hypothetical protein